MFYLQGNSCQFRIQTTVVDTTKKERRNKMFHEHNRCSIIQKQITKRTLVYTKVVTHILLHPVGFLKLFCFKFLLLLLFFVFIFLYDLQYWSQSILKCYRDNIWIWKKKFSLCCSHVQYIKSQKGHGWRLQAKKMIKMRARLFYNQSTFTIRSSRRNVSELVKY